MNKLLPLSQKINLVIESDLIFKVYVILEEGNKVLRGLPLFITDSIIMRCRLPFCKIMSERYL